jgi:predicted phosphodiesterase
MYFPLFISKKKIIRKLFFVLAIFLWLFKSFLIAIYWKIISLIRYEMMQNGWASCGFRIKPFVQFVGSRDVRIIWETSCEHRNVLLSWMVISNHNNDFDDEWMLERNRITRSQKDKNIYLYEIFLLELPVDSAIQCILNMESMITQEFSFDVPADLTEKLPFEGQLGEIEIAILGDNQIGSTSFIKICRNIAKRYPHLVVHLGDMVERSWMHSNWQTQFFDSLGHWSDLSLMSAFLICQGNHDVYSSAKYRSDYFSSSNEPSDAYYHSLTMGSARWIILDTNDESEEQVTWLEEELNSPESQIAPFRIVLCHVPPFLEFWEPKAWKNGESSWPVYVKERLVPLFGRYRVDLVISGHQHNYQRGRHNGVTYVISGGAGGDIDKVKVQDEHVYEVTAFQHHYLMMRMSSNQLIITAYSLSNCILDTIKVLKQIEGS